MELWIQDLSGVDSRTPGSGVFRIQDSSRWVFLDSRPALFGFLVWLENFALKLLAILAV